MIKEKYELWLKNAVKDPDLIKELEKIKGDENAVNDAFYTDLEFGTAGLRGVIGAGCNRMNVYTVAQATQGLAQYVLSQSDKPSVAIAYDSRIKSDLFARTTAEVFAANGVKVYIYKELMPTPMLSFAIRYLKCDAGVVVTASHNPSKYNGYKAYDETGCQLGPEAADYVLNIMQSVDIFTGVKTSDFDEGLKSGIIEYIGEDVINAFLDRVESSRVSKDMDLSNLKIIYTPLNGTGNKPVRRILERIGIKNIEVVKEQENPDGNFPTVPYPNPEIKQVFEIALEMAKSYNPDILLATDPDCDRVGIAVNVNGNYELFSGNDVGVLLLYYMLSVKKETGKLPKNPVAVTTIVSTGMCKKIAADFGCKLIETLTGFKFIGEQITELAKTNEQDRYILGFEESYGYLAGSYVRDKDAVTASMLICEMTAYYKSKGKNLKQVLFELYEKYGYFFCAQKSFTCEGQSGIEKIKAITEKLRANPPAEIAGSKVAVIKDIKTSVCKNLKTNEETKINLPKSNVLCYYLEDGDSLIVRPSGTEPKIKIYIGAVSYSCEKAEKRREEIIAAGTKLLGF